MGTILGTSSSDTLSGTSTNDTIKGLAGDDSLSGLDGNDTLNGGLGNDTLNGGTGTDTATYVNATGSVSVNLITGTSSGADGADTLIGIENVTGSNFDDILQGNGQGNVLDGGNGDDTLVAFASPLYLTKLIGGAGFDTADFSHFGGDQIIYINAVGLSSVDMSGVEKVIAGSYADTILGSAGNDEVWAGAGNDTIWAGGGSDSLHGDAGDDRFFGADVMEGASNDLFDGGAGTDLVDFENATSGVAVDLRLTTSQFLGAAMGSATFLSVEDINATQLDDVLHGNDANNRLASGAGSDQLFGEGGNDTLLVTLGDKVVDGGSGNDTLWFADLPNTTPFSFSPPDLTVSLELQGQVQQTGAGALTLTNVENVTGASAKDILTGDSNANALIGNSGDDVLTGNAGDDYLEGDFGFDQLFGGDGNDHLTGDFDNDQLFGGSGDDSLNGGWGDDFLQGGTGHDQFIGDMGIDTVSFADDAAAVTVDLTLGTAVGADGTETLSEIENITGSAFNDQIVGSAANNFIDGGAGADTMSGGDGDDTFVVDNAGDKVSETNVTGGTDLVQSSVDFTLGANVENLTLLGTADLRGNGNSLSNVLTGNDGVNILVGNDGNDTYVLNTVGDRAVESSATGGYDTVYSNATYILGSNLEQLFLTGTASNGTGNSLNNVLIGNSEANILDGHAGADQMWGGDGDDMYIVDNVGDEIYDNGTLGGLDTVKASVTFNLGTELENLTLTGTGAIDGTGNGLNNTIIGNSAANVIDGSFGADMMKGGAGDDTYIVDNVGDKIGETSTGGVDTTKSSVSFILGSYVENLTLTGTGDINATGNALANTLLGTSGANFIDGRGGADTMRGFGGDDTYVVDNAGDVIIESAGAGTDKVRSTISYTIGANVEQLFLMGSSIINGTGNPLDNYLVGNSNDNVLDGAAGADTMSGGTGNDTYVFDNVGDYAYEEFDSGIDTAVSSITLSLGTNVTRFLENITLTGTDAINATGDAGANILIGNSAANVLDGNYGADVMKGGAGDDTYVVWDIGDLVVETSTGGVDTVHASLSFTLASYVENLVLDVWQADGTGNSLANTITGSAGDNILDGKAGADILIGNGGKDTFIVDNAGDQVIETNADFYIDTVQSSVSFTLGANLEDLKLTRTSAISGTGNALDNHIIGNDAANTLSGLAGSDRIAGGGGSDTLTGGAGFDTFVFDSALGSANVDAITDFSSVNDTIVLSQGVFSALATGALGANAFQTGTAANDAFDRIIYDSTSGRIYYDADGNGAGAKVLFATVAGGTVLTNADFEVVGAGASAMAVASAKTVENDPVEHPLGLDALTLLSHKFVSSAVFDGYDFSPYHFDFVI